MKVVVMESSVLPLTRGLTLANHHARAGVPADVGGTA